MIRESLADSNQIQWQVLAKSLQLQLADSRLWQVLYIYSIFFPNWVFNLNFVYFLLIYTSLKYVTGGDAGFKI